MALGIRPEYVEIATGDVPGKMSFTLYLIETLESEALLHATLADARFVVISDTLNSIG